MTSKEAAAIAVQKKPGTMFYLTMFSIAIVTMIFHEITHWLAGKALGYDMYFTLTTASLIEGSWRSEADYALVSIAGPLFTFAVGLFGAWLAIVKKMRFGYELIFVAFMQRFLAMIMSALFIPNDEARVSLFLGWDWWVLPVTIIIPLFVLAVWSSIKLRFGVLVNFFCYLATSIAFTLIVAADGQLVGFSGPSIVDPLLPEAVRSTSE